jgi:hypothetical protein
MGIPNPVAYAKLANWITCHWADLAPYSGASAFSLSKPVDTKPERAISSEHSLDERTTRRIELRANARFVLHADINRFYPSIYTHAIPWAVHEKSKVKAAMAAKDEKSLWANTLDVLVRGQNENQTLGIPIGPDCSLLLAEVLLGSIDAELIRQFPSLRGIRYVDDYEFVFHDRSEAERVVNVLQSLLSNFELALNATKTRIIELPDVVEPLWISRLRTYVFRDAGIKGQRSDLTAFFDTAFDYVRKEPNEGILKYTVARLNAIDVHGDNWGLFENLLAHCALTEPACLPQVVEQIVHYKAQGQTINSSLWSDCLNRIVSERLPLGQASEASWAMWLMKILGIPLSTEAEAAVAGCEDSIAALMGLGLASVGLANLASLSALNSFAEPTELLGPQWLLCYEGCHKGWISAPSGADTMAADERFNFLHKKGVSFFDIAVAPPFPRRYQGSGGGAGGGGY